MSLNKLETKFRNPLVEIEASQEMRRSLNRFDPRHVIKIRGDSKRCSVAVIIVWRGSQVRYSLR